MEKETIINEKQEYIDSKCPNCGSKLRFLPGTKKVICDSCNSTFKINSLGYGNLEDEEIDYKETLEKIKNSSIETKKQRTIHCENCGGLIILNDKTISTKCPFCNSNKVVEEEKQEEIIKIVGIIPFVFAKEDVERLFSSWIKKKFFAPKKFKKGKIFPVFSMIYIPFYTYDSSTISNYTAQRGDYYYVTKTVKSGDSYRTVTERHIRWTNVRGTLTYDFDDVLINGTNSFLNNYINAISNYDLSKLEKYQEEFLLGHYAERASVKLDEGFYYAKNIMNQTIKAKCIRRIGGDTYRFLKINTRYEDVTFKQIMLPICNGIYSYNKRNYRFVCNGQTGKFYGKYPLSPLKITILVLIILLLLAAIFLLVYSIVIKYYY